MPDVRDLLREGAGDPVAPLDLDAVLRGGARRTARRRAALAVAAVVPVAVTAVLLIGPAQEQLAPATPASPGPLPTASAGPPAPQRSGPPASAPAAPLPGPGRSASAPATSASTADGEFFAFITAIDGGSSGAYGVTYDKVDYLGDACVAGVPRPTRAGAIAKTCYRDVNPLLRHVPASATTSVVVRDSSGEPLPSDWAGLRKAVQQETVAGPVRPWRITVRAGVVTSILGEVYEAA